MGKKKSIPWPEVTTAANIHHRCCYYIIDNVAFSFGAQENMHKTFEAIKNWSWIAPTIMSQPKQNIIINIRSQQFPKQRNKNNKQTKNA